MRLVGVIDGVERAVRSLRVARARARTRDALQEECLCDRRCFGSTLDRGSCERYSVDRVFHVCNLIGKCRAELGRQYSPTPAPPIGHATKISSRLEMSNPSPSSTELATPVLRDNDTGWPSAWGLVMSQSPYFQTGGHPHATGQPALPRMITRGHIDVTLDSLACTLARW